MVYKCSKRALISGQEAGKRVEKAISHKTSNTDRIYSKEMFTKEFANLFGEKHELSTTDFEVLLKFLSRDQSSILYDGKVCLILPIARDTALLTTETDH